MYIIRFKLLKITKQRNFVAAAVSLRYSKVYKRSKDVVRLWGTPQSTINKARRGLDGRVIPFNEHITDLMSQKSKDRVAGMLARNGIDSAQLEFTLEPSYTINVLLCSMVCFRLRSHLWCKKKMGVRTSTD